jgi:hypothetical protein
VNAVYRTYGQYTALRTCLTPIPSALTLLSHNMTAVPCHMSWQQYAVIRGSGSKPYQADPMPIVSRCAMQHKVVKSNSCDISKAQGLLCPLLHSCLHSRKSPHPIRKPSVIPDPTCYTADIRDGAQ